MAYKITSQQSLMNLAAFYCSKRETSRAKLGMYLKRKCRENDIEDSISMKWIPEVLDFCEESRLVNDQRYTEILIRDYTTRGKGFRYIEQKLKEKGIPKELRIIPQNVEDEFERALKLARKKLNESKNKVDQKLKRSPHSRLNPEFELRNRLLQKLISSGFSLEVSKRAIGQVLKD
ncbi:MAG: regulatory protein RecX [Bdellovibrionota bacterium]